MPRNEDGFSLIEMLIVMTLLVIIIAISTNSFSLILKQSGQQTRIAETQIESNIGLNLLRVDLEHAGYGLPWSFQNPISYSEAVPVPAAGFNDSPASPPRAVLSGNNVVGSDILEGTDYLVIKSTVAGTGVASQRWSYVVAGSSPRIWGSDDLQDGVRSIVINPKVSNAVSRQLVMSGSGNSFSCGDKTVFFSTFWTGFCSAGLPSVFTPLNTSEQYLIYGVDADNDLRMPFNRADYYIKRPPDGTPHLCAPNTGTLYRANVNHQDGELTELPILDCAADMQMVFMRDTDGDGTVDNYTDDISLLTDDQIRNQVKEVRVYILAHEGRMDRSFQYPNPTVVVGEYGIGSTYNLAEKAGSDWRNFRWKVYTIAVKPKNLK